MGKTAFVFSGQGAQFPGMGRFLYESSPAAKEVFDMAESQSPGLLKLCFESEPERLTQTVNAQPALFATDLAYAQALREAGVKADMAAGFSLGEIPAAAFAGLFSASDAFGVVLERAALMQTASEENPGAMAAVLGLPSAEVEALCAELGAVWPVNYNGGGQIVCAGKSELIPALITEAKARGGRGIKLAVSGAFHSPFMGSASEKLLEKLKKIKFNQPLIPLYANLDARPYTVERGAATMAAQVKSPVRWEEIVLAMSEAGADTFIECGPGKVLCGLITKILPSARVYSIKDAEDLRRTAEEVNAI